MSENRHRARRAAARPVDAAVVLDLAPPSAARLPLVFERLPQGGVRVTSPDLPGWSTTARGPHSVARCVDDAFVELQIAAYARSRGTTYDAEQHADPPAHAVPVPQPGPHQWVDLGDGTMRSPAGRVITDPIVIARVKARQGRGPTSYWRVKHDPTHWVPLPSGSWRSPSGRTYRADAAVVRQVIARREELGLPVRAEPDP